SCDGCGESDRRHARRRGDHCHRAPESDSHLNSPLSLSVRTTRAVWRRTRGFGRSECRVCVRCQLTRRRHKLRHAGSVSQHPGVRSVAEVTAAPAAGVEEISLGRRAYLVAEYAVLFFGAIAAFDVLADGI